MFVRQLISDSLTVRSERIWGSYTCTAEERMLTD